MLGGRDEAMENRSSVRVSLSFRFLLGIVVYLEPWSAVIVPPSKLRLVEDEPIFIHGVKYGL